jgi:hypothetical protein
MKKVAPVISYLFHPLLMPSLGLLILLNSGTYLSLLDPAAKRAIMFVMALGTLVFPLMMLPILQYRNLALKSGESTREERLIPQIIILALYIITLVYFRRLPLSQAIQAYVLSVNLTLFLVIIINFRFRISVHAAALGGLCGLILALIFLYETPLEGLLMLFFLASGITGSARMALGNRWGEVLTGFILGLGVVLVTILVY